MRWPESHEDPMKADSELRSLQQVDVLFWLKGYTETSLDDAA